MSVTGLYTRHIGLPQTGDHDAKPRKICLSSKGKLYTYDHLLSCLDQGPQADVPDLRPSGHDITNIGPLGCVPAGHQHPIPDRPLPFDRLLPPNLEHRTYYKDLSSSSQKPGADLCIPRSSVPDICKIGASGCIPGGPHHPMPDTPPSPTREQHTHDIMVSCLDQEPRADLPTTPQSAHDYHSPLTCSGQECGAAHPDQGQSVFDRRNLGPPGCFPSEYHRPGQRRPLPFGVLPTKLEQCAPLSNVWNDDRHLLPPHRNKGRKRSFSRLHDSHPQTHIAPKSPPPTPPTPDHRSAVGIPSSPKSLKRRRDRLRCTLCLDDHKGFGGLAELDRHMTTKHQKLGEPCTRWICDLRNVDTTRQPFCKNCYYQKLYPRPDNAASHLRRMHYHPKVDGFRGQGRAGTSGGVAPSLQVLKDKKQIIPVSVPDGSKEWFGDPPPPPKRRQTHPPVSVNAAPIHGTAPTADATTQSLTPSAVFTSLSEINKATWCRPFYEEESLSPVNLAAVKTSESLRSTTPLPLALITPPLTEKSEHTSPRNGTGHRTPIDEDSVSPLSRFARAGESLLGDLNSMDDFSSSGLPETTSHRYLHDPVTDYKTFDDVDDLWGMKAHGPGHDLDGGTLAVSILDAPPPYGSSLMGPTCDDHPLTPASFPPTPASSSHPPATPLPHDWDRSGPDIDTLMGGHQNSLLPLRSHSHLDCLISRDRAVKTEALSSSPGEAIGWCRGTELGLPFVTISNQRPWLAGSTLTSPNRGSPSPSQRGTYLLKEHPPEYSTAQRDYPVIGYPPDDLCSPLEGSEAGAREKGERPRPLDALNDIDQILGDMFDETHGLPPDGLPPDGLPLHVPPSRAVTNEDQRPIQRDYWHDPSIPACGSGWKDHRPEAHQLVEDSLATGNNGLSSHLTGDYRSSSQEETFLLKEDPPETLTNLEEILSHHNPVPPFIMQQGWPPDRLSPDGRSASSRNDQKILGKLLALPRRLPQHDGRLRGCAPDDLPPDGLPPDGLPPDGLPNDYTLSLDESSDSDQLSPHDYYGMNETMKSDLWEKVLETPSSVDETTIHQHEHGTIQSNGVTETMEMFESFPSGESLHFPFEEMLVDGRGGEEEEAQQSLWLLTQQPLAIASEPHAFAAKTHWQNYHDEKSI